jgi:hypothetical protein
MITARAPLTGTVTGNDETQWKPVDDVSDSSSTMRKQHKSENITRLQLRGSLKLLLLLEPSLTIKLVLSKNGRNIEV